MVWGLFPFCYLITLQWGLLKNAATETEDKEAVVNKKKEKKRLKVWAIKVSVVLPEAG